MCETQLNMKFQVGKFINVVREEDKFEVSFMTHQYGSKTRWRYDQTLGSELLCDLYVKNANKQKYKAVSSKHFVFSAREQFLLPLNLRIEMFVPTYGLREISLVSYPVLKLFTPSDRLKNGCKPNRAFFASNLITVRWECAQFRVIHMEILDFLL